jgi:TPR repeat protein
MADVAHDTPGPASPKPGDEALQQTSRADSPDKGKLRVFISYSRDDLRFADQLNAALDACNFDCVMDRHGISGGEDWRRRLGTLISEADTVVFVLSPTSARSEICAWEVEEATRLGKRILPINCQSLEGTSPPPQLRERNYIYFYEDQKVADSGFGTGLSKLIAALNTDFDWLREHTRYLQRATEWDKRGRAPNRLLSGDDIAEAKAWAASRPRSAPEPTALHLEFIRASEEEAEARSRRETAFHQAQEALKQAAVAQRKRATIRNIALVAVSIFAVLAGFLYWDADQHRRIAEAQREALDQKFANLQTRFIAQQVVSLVSPPSNPGPVPRPVDSVKRDEVLLADERAAERALKSALSLLSTNGQGVAQDYAKAREWYEKAADKGNAAAMSGIGLLYANGRGVAQDYAKAREWFERAAERGDATAMFSIGLLYANGEGVPQDYAKAREWFEKAADNGNADAMAQLKQLRATSEAAGARREAPQR